jgi:hypothetical protein
MTLTPPALRKVVEMALSARPVEIGCDDCEARLDAFAEMALAGRDAAEALPLVEEHLARCPCCRVEFEALLAALRAAERGGGA